MEVECQLSLEGRMGRLVATCYLGRAANPTVIWGQQRRDGYTDDREREPNETLFSVAPKRVGV